MKKDKVINDLITLYSINEHADVIKYIDNCYNSDVQRVVEIPDMGKLYIPKNLDKYKYYPVLSAHTDTVFNLKPNREDIIIDKYTLYTKPDFGHGLGADDRNGIYILSEVMKFQPEKFIFAVFNYEESGMMGFSNMQSEIDELKHKISVFIGLDRMGSGKYAIYGSESVTLLESTQFKKRGFEYGSITDVSVLANHTNISCFNIPVGFYNAHTSHEQTDIVVVIDVLEHMDCMPMDLWEHQYTRRCTLKHHHYGETTWSWN